MPQRWFQFPNAFTGTPAGGGDGSSRSNASGDWATFLTAFGASSNTANILMVNSDACLDHAGGLLGAGGQTARYMWGQRPGTGTIVRPWDTGRQAARKHSHWMIDTMHYTVSDAPSFTTANKTWAVHSGSVWKIDVGVMASSGRIASLYACDGEVRGQYGDARYELNFRASAAACEAAGDWFSSQADATTQTLYVNSGSSTLNPDQVFGGISYQIISSNNSLNVALQPLGVQRATFERLAIIGGQLVLGGLSNVASEGLTFVDTRIELQNGHRGLYLNLNNSAGGYAAPMRRIMFDRLRVRRPIANSLVQRVDHEGAFTGFDHVGVEGYVSDVAFRDPYIETRLTHTAFAAICWPARLPGGWDLDYPRNVEFYGTSFGSAEIRGPQGPGAAANGSDKCYGRALNLGTDGQVTMRNFVVQGFATGSQVAGRVAFDKFLFKSGAAPYVGFDNAGNQNNKGGGGTCVFGKSSIASDIGVTDMKLTNGVFHAQTVTSYAVKLGHDVSSVNDYRNLWFGHCTFIDTSSGNKVTRTDTDTGAFTYGPRATVAVLQWNLTGLAAYYPAFVDCASIIDSMKLFGRSLWDVPTPGSFGHVAYGCDELQGLNGSSLNNQAFASLAEAGYASSVALRDGAAVSRLGVTGAGSASLNDVQRGAVNAVGAVELA